MWAMSQVDCCVGFWNGLPVGTSLFNFSSALKSTCVYSFLRATQRSDASWLVRLHFRPFPSGPCVSDSHHYTHTLLVIENGFELAECLNLFSILCYHVSTNAMRPTRTCKSHSDEHPTEHVDYVLRHLAPCDSSSEAENFLDENVS